MSEETEVVGEKSPTQHQLTLTDDEIQFIISCICEKPANQVLGLLKKISEQIG